MSFICDYKKNTICINYIKLTNKMKKGYNFGHLNCDHLKSA